MANARSTWSSKIVRERTGARLERVRAKQEILKSALRINADVMNVKASQLRPTAVFSDTDRRARRRALAARAPATRRTRSAARNTLTRHG